MGNRAHFRHFAAALTLASAVFGPSSAQAQHRRAPEVRLAPKSLRDRFGLDAAARLLTSGNPTERRLGVERLAGLDSDKARDRLAAALQPGSPVYADPRARLAAIRVLAGHLEKEPYRAAVAAAFSDVAEGRAGLAPLLRRTAALALAREGSRQALTPLVTAMLVDGPAAADAREVLLAHPPKELSVFRNDLDKYLDPRLIAFLGDLGDPRTLGWLRSQLKSDDVERLSQAAIALAKIGDGHAQVLVKKWKGDKDPFKRIQAAEVAMWLDHPEAATLIAKLLGKAKTRGAGLRLAGMSLSPALVPTLEAVIEAEVTPAERRLATAVLARMGEDRSAQALLKLLNRPELATQAALALATNPSPTAAVGLSRALSQSKAGAGRRLILRAAIVRALRTGERIGGLSSALGEALAAGSPADRAVGAFGLSALGDRSVSDLLARSESEVIEAAARGALVRGPAGLSALLPRLKDPESRALGAAGLLVGTGGLSPSDLAELAEQGGLAAPLAAYRLAVVDSRPHRSRLLALLAGTDRVVARQVILGLGKSPESDAVSILTSLYPFEPDRVTRAAGVRALSLRVEKRREATLKLARDLDPDPEIRALAARALKGRAQIASATPAGGRTLWMTLREVEPRGARSGRPALVIRDDGVAWPAMSAPDGVLLVPGLAELGHVSFRLAPTPEKADVPPTEKEAEATPTSAPSLAPAPSSAKDEAKPPPAPAPSP